jgi:hypothetical protein
LFRGIKICVTKRTAVVIPVTIDEPGILPTPFLEPTLLHLIRSPRPAVLRNYSRLEMVREGEDQMCWALGYSAAKHLPEIARKPARHI